MIRELLIGLLCLALGGLCLNRSIIRQSAQRTEDAKFRTIIPMVLGVLFLLIAKALLVFAAVEMLQGRS